eukprot:TRINITY_DN8293_c0_g2_i1.p1 TRINITY_DN8293_c0_g2~~TRINITY_DN8293_c0_g2_i1.p1  ORF type:complete len:340 (+),score=41.74 TRINITY_DN8293_c0_g2_i1:47-1021(+)
MAEILSRKPAYSTMGSDEVIEAVGDIFRQPPVRPVIDTTGVPNVIVSIMERCWDNNPQLRLEFVTIDQQLQSMDIGGIGKSLFLRGTDRKRQAGLLCQFFPPEIAVKVRSGKTKWAPGRRDIITIVKMGIRVVGDASANGRADALHSLYEAIDTACAKHSMMKLVGHDKEIVCVGNVLKENPFHVIDACELALSVFEHQRQYIPAVELLAAIHCGDCTELVLGTVAPQYTLLGDTAKTASLLLSTASSGDVIISWLAATILEAQCASRGLPALSRRLVAREDRSIGGHGVLQTFLLCTDQQRKKLASSSQQQVATSLKDLESVL